MPPNSHSELGASKTERWWNCPGSVAAERGLPDEQSEYAAEGTAAHAEIEHAILYGKRTSADEAIQAFLGFVTPMLDDTDTCFWSEERVTLGLLAPPAPMFGTADFVAFDTVTGLLTVADYKHGQGVVVEVVGNKQLLYYALGVLLSPRLVGKRVENIRLAVVQPRAFHPQGPIRTWTITIDELLEFSFKLLERAEAAMQANAPRKAGAWCRFCKAGGTCTTRKDAMALVAQTDFTALPALPDPQTIPPEVVSNILTHAGEVEAFFTAVKAVAVRRLEQGEEVPGFKLVEKRANRKWASEKEFDLWALTQIGSTALYVSPAPKSVAQVEKIVGKKNLPAALWTKTSSGVNLVPLSDPRPALTPGHEFTALPLLGSGDNVGTQTGDDT